MTQVEIEVPIFPTTYHYLKDIDFEGIKGIDALKNDRKCNIFARCYIVYRSLSRSA